MNTQDKIKQAEKRIEELKLLIEHWKKQNEHKKII
jgi:hypothetical protein